MLVEHTWGEDPVEDVLLPCGVTRGILGGTNSSLTLAGPVFVQALKKVRDGLENGVHNFWVFLSIRNLKQSVMCKDN